MLFAAKIRHDHQFRPLFTCQLGQNYLFCRSCGDMLIQFQAMDILVHYRTLMTFKSK